MASSSPTSSICCRDWSASRLWWLTARSPASAVTASSRRSASSRANGSCSQAPPIGLRERHVAFFFDEFRDALPILCGHGQLELLKRLRSEQENVRAALECALTSPALAEKGVELAGALFWFWTKRGQFEEGSLWLERALAVRVDPPGLLRARALLGLANICTSRGSRQRACRRGASRSAGRMDEPWVMSFALFIQALAALERGDHDRAVACALEAREKADAGGGAVEHAGPLWVLGNVAMLNGDPDRAAGALR